MMAAVHDGQPQSREFRPRLIYDNGRMTTQCARLALAGALTYARSSHPHCLSISPGARLNHSPLIRLLFLTLFKRPKVVLFQTQRAHTRRSFGGISFALLYSYLYTVSHFFLPSVFYTCIYVLFFPCARSSCPSTFRLLNSSFWTFQK